MVALTLAGGVALRLLLAARGWSHVNSDEATLGLMVDDILWHGAHPVFLYGQHYLGSLQAYLAVPFFVMLGPTDAALHTTTTFEVLLFLLALYAFTRQVYSSGIAWLTLVLLAPGPEQALFYELRAAAHAQDTLLFGSLLLLLTCLLLRQRWSARAKLALNLGIGLAAGLGLWGTFLIMPFIVAAGLALSVEATRRLRPLADRRSRLWKQFAPLALGAILGSAAFIAGSIASRGVFLGEILAANGTETIQSAPAALLSHLLALGQQGAGTFFLSLPHLLGSGEVCVNCPLWPMPGSNPAPAEVWRAALISALFSLVALMVWLIAARPCVSATWRAWRGKRQEAAPDEVSTAQVLRDTARQWGRAMLVIAAALTVLEYVITRSSYQTADTSTRYLVGLYVCTPLLADPLWQGSRQVWQWLRARTSASSAGHVERSRPRLPAFLAVVLLTCLLVLNSAGAFLALGETTDRQGYGVPAGARDRQLLAFFQTHQITRFYTTYWVCNRLMFEAEEQVACAVVSDDNIFEPGINREPAYISLVAAAPHPAYLFDLTTNEVAPAMLTQVAALIVRGDSRFAGYTSIQLTRYVLYYYAGSP